MNRISFLKPAVPKYWLFTLAGLFWSSIGIRLCLLGIGFLKPLQEKQSFIPLYVYILGCFIGVIVSYLFVFRRIVVGNIKRIQNFAGETICLFAFQSWQGYIIALGMEFFGKFMHTNAPIPRPYVAVWIISTGGSMIRAGWQYFNLNWRRRRSSATSSSSEII